MVQRRRHTSWGFQNATNNEFPGFSYTPHMGAGESCNLEMPQGTDRAPMKARGLV